MNSTSTSKVLIDIQNLGLSFKVPLYRSDSVRSTFTGFFKNPKKIFQRNPERLILFENLNLKVHEGDRLGLVGINGVGKTSLCRCIAGVYLAQKGQIKKYGHVRAIFDTAIGVQPELTGRENAKLMAEFLYPSEPNRHDLIEESLKFSELGEFLDAPVKFYSNGMHTRLCLSLVSARPGDVLILDEVYEGADQFFRQKIVERVNKMIELSGAVIFVSHSFEQIKKTCNRVAILNRNGVVFSGSPAEAENFYVSLYGSNAI